MFACIREQHLHILKYFFKIGIAIDPNPLMFYLLSETSQYSHVSMFIYMSQFVIDYKYYTTQGLDSFYIVVSTFYNNEEWTRLKEIKGDYLFDPNLSLIIASFAF